MNFYGLACLAQRQYWSFPKFSAFPAGKSCDITTCWDSEKHQHGPGQFSWRYPPFAIHILNKITWFRLPRSHTLWCGLWGILKELTNPHGGFLKWGSSKSSILIGSSIYKSSIFVYLHFRTPPHILATVSTRWAIFFTRSPAKQVARDPRAGHGGEAPFPFRRSVNTKPHRKQWPALRPRLLWDSKL